MPHAYHLDADPAEIKDHGYSIRLSLIGSLVGARTVVTVNKPGELVAAKLAHGLHVLEVNSHEIQHHTVTSPPRPLTAVHVGHRPVTKHGPGFKAIQYSLLVQREEAPVGSQ